MWSNNTREKVLTKKQKQLKEKILTLIDKEVEIVTDNTYFYRRFFSVTGKLTQLSDTLFMVDNVKTIVRFDIEEVSSIENGSIVLV